MCVSRGIGVHSHDADLADESSEGRSKQRPYELSLWVYCPAAKALYPAVEAFFRASSASAVVSSGVVFTDRTAPPAANAMAIAAASTLVGNSVMVMTS